MTANKKSYLGFDPEKSVLVRINRERVHFKNTREVCATLKGMKLEKALKYLNDVIKHKRAVPFRRFNGGVGRTAQAKEWGVSQARWPVKSCSAILKVLIPVRKLAEAKGLSGDKLKIQRAVINKSRAHSRRNYRAHGRLQFIRCNLSSVAMVIAEDDLPVPKCKAISTANAD